MLIYLFILYLARRFFALLPYLRSGTQWPSPPNLVRASGLSDLFEVWLALPSCDITSLAGRRSLRFSFAAVLLPAAFTNLCCCCVYSVSLPLSLHLCCRSSPMLWFFPLSALRVGSGCLLSPASLGLSSLLWFLLLLGLGCIH